ncbi:hypothetical protein [Aeoliella mucimassa]|uniref:Uncharacterized protein n=1 Tax=Aeoliella mucimassa TaxID=2527972 RepID=A0A518AUF2_9BACT|nr:hypothetical protein [Aeoliella mucimassa]QDU58350.1 hypothetical protein Pan181_45840 [Aeoliella mucimassa]
MKNIVLASVLIHVVLLACLAPWLKTTMEFSQKEESQRSEEVRQRELARQEHERLEREQRQLDEDSARKLREEAELKGKEELEDVVEELRDLRNEILQEQRELLSEFRERDFEDVLHFEKDLLLKEIKQLTNQVANATAQAAIRNLTIANVTGSQVGIRGFVSNVRVYEGTLPSLQESEDSSTPASNLKLKHQWPLQQDFVDKVTHKAGKSVREPHFLDKSLSFEQADQQLHRAEKEPFESLSLSTEQMAYFGTTRHDQINLWPIDLGTQFAIALDTKLFPADRSQALVSNTSASWVSGFRLAVDTENHNAVVKLITIGPEGSQRREIKARAGSFNWGQWHEIAIVMDTDRASARIYIDNEDVTEPTGQVAQQVYTQGSVLDQSLQQATDEFAKQVAEQPLTPQSAEEYKEQLSELSEQMDSYIQKESPLNDVHHSMTLARQQADRITQRLDTITAKPDLAEMNDTSSSQADKMEVATSPTNADPAELYAEAVEIERQIAEAHADMEAAKEATVENTAYSEARSHAFAATPARPDMANQLSQASETMPGTIGELSNFRDQLAQATNEAQDMVARAEMLTGKNSGNSQQASQQGRSLSTSSAMRSMATQDLGYGAVIDLTGFGGGGVGDSSGLRRDSSSEGADMAFRQKPISHLRLDQGDILQKAMPGRRFTSDSMRRGWLYIDTWYVIGPWENESQIDFNKRHPPEQVVDFDAKYYDGKYGDQAGHPQQVLKWEFYQSDQVRCQPPVVHGASTYYAYTDVWFEEARDMLIAVASDDAARVLLNDQVIWQDDGLSPWQMGEGYRRVHFRKGYNNLLVRVENGPAHCVWSVLLCPPEVLENQNN